MITQKTAENIWSCYREIEAGKKLLQDMEKVEKDNPRHKHEQHLKDAFGHKQELQLGIPMGESGHRLYGVSPKLALSIIRSHIAEKERDLVEANEMARVELDSEVSDCRITIDPNRTILDQKITNLAANSVPLPQ